MQKKVLPISGATIFASATVFLYGSSTAYMEGYLRTLKLDADVLDRNFHQVLYSGFLISFETLLWTAACCALASFFYSHLVFPLFIDYLSKGWKQKRLVVKIERHLRLNKRPDTAPERILKHRTRWAVAIAVAFIASIFLLAHYEQKGKKVALEMIQRLAKEEADQSSQPVDPLPPGAVRVKIDDRVRTLVHLACGARNCAGWERTERLVYYYPQTGHAYAFAAEPQVPVK